MNSTVGQESLVEIESFPAITEELFQFNGLCANESMFNVTFRSLYCRDNYSRYEILIISVLTDNRESKRRVRNIVLVLFGIIFVLGLIGNALVVLVVVSNRQMRNTTNILIANLAMADLLFIIFTVPFTAADHVMRYWPFGEIWCKMVKYLINVSIYVSVYTLVLMSLDRFLAVVYPVSAISIRTKRNIYWAIAITWAFILGLCIPSFFTYGLIYSTNAYEEQVSCTFKQDYDRVAFQIAFMLTSYVIPLGSICFLYFGMLLRLWRSASIERTSQKSLRGRKRATRMVVVVVVVFAVCWLPIQTVLLLKSLHLYEINNFSLAIAIIAHVLCYANSCVNPILYAFTSENFRKAFVRQSNIHCCCPPDL